MHETFDKLAAFQPFLRGEELYGDALSPEEIEKWYEEEENGYYNLAHNDRHKQQAYCYHSINDRHGFRFLHGERFRKAIVFGCADGEDVAPIAGMVDEFFAVEPAEGWWCQSIGGKPAHFRKPNKDGSLDFSDGEFDLAISLGVLHHIPNVTAVIREVSRVCANRAKFLIREPISSMGRWWLPRAGCTKNERGIPVAWLENRLRQNGFAIQRKNFCLSPLSALLTRTIGVPPMNSREFAIVDEFICRITRGANWYYRDRYYKKIGPGSVFIIANRVE